VNCLGFSDALLTGFGVWTGGLPTMEPAHPLAS
jgi:hypothetical protein